MNTAEIDRLAHFEEWYWWHRARIQIVTSVLRRFVPSQPGRILDVGCGAGATSLGLREFGDVLGVDAHAGATAAAGARGLPVATMDACHLALRSQSFDLVVALDVLEHLAEDGLARLELSRVLRPGGRLLVSVPAYQWLWSSHDLALGHVRRYTRSRLVAALEEVGFEVELASYAMSAALLPAAAVRLLERVLPRRLGASETRSGYVALPAPANTALGWLVALDRHVIGRAPIPWGLSVVAIARKAA